MSKISIDDLRELISQGECGDPLVLLESLSCGIDPRRTSLIKDLVDDINEFNDGNISASDWEEVVKLVNKKYDYEKVSVDVSLAAAKSLSDFLHPKRKHIDTTSTNGSSGSSTKLTEEEIEIFKEKFNEDF